MLLLLLRVRVVLFVNTGFTVDGGRTIKHIPLL
jgi:hypothetical protein